MGVAYLLAYIIGALFIWLGTDRLLSDLLAGEELIDGAVAAGGGMLLVVVAGLLQAIVARRRGHEGVLDGREPMGARWFATCAAMGFGPLVWAWVQFELFWNPIDIYPLVTLLGMCGLVFGVVDRLSGQSRHRGTLATVAVALVGVPAALLGVGLQTSHFNHHLSDVRTTTVHHWDGVVEHIFEADVPTYHQEITAIGDETGELLKAFAEAKPVDVETLMAEGRLAWAEDGTMIILDEEGEPMEEANLDEAFDEAAAADAEAADAEREAARAAFEAEVEALRTGGRLFSP